MREACGAIATKKSFNLFGYRWQLSNANYFSFSDFNIKTLDLHNNFTVVPFLFFRTLFVVFLITIFLITLNIALVCELCCGVTISRMTTTKLDANLLLPMNKFALIKFNYSFNFTRFNVFFYIYWIKESKRKIATERSKRAR